MTRLGWGILVAILLVAGAFASMLSVGSAPPGSMRERVRQVIPSFRERRESGGPLLVPVAEVPRSALRGSWGDPRGGGTRGHHGIDIPAAAGTPVIAAADGTVEKLFQSARGGTTLYVRTPDLRWVHYYAHLWGYAPGIVAGRKVRAGETIAFVGDTGDAGAGNYHLHFGVQAMQPGERWWQGEDVDPYPLLAGNDRDR